MLINFNVQNYDITGITKFGDKYTIVLNSKQVVMSGKQFKKYAIQILQVSPVMMLIVKTV